MSVNKYYMLVDSDGDPVILQHNSKVLMFDDRLAAENYIGPGESVVELPAALLSPEALRLSTLIVGFDGTMAEYIRLSDELFQTLYNYEKANTPPVPEDRPAIVTQPPGTGRFSPLLIHSSGEQDHSFGD